LLALAVVAERRRLITDGVPMRATASHSSSSVAARPNGASESRGRRELLLARALLRVCSAAPHGLTGVIASIASMASIRHVLELERNHVDLAANAAARRDLVVATEFDVGHLPGRRFGLRRKVWTW